MGWQDIYKKKMQAAGLENDIRSTDDVQVFYRKEPEQYGDWRDSFMKKMEDSGLSGDIRLGQTQTAARQTVTAPATTTTAAKKRERQVVSPYGTFLGGFSFARGRQKSEKELADEKAQQEAYVKEYRRLAGLDLDDYRAEVEQAGKKAQESKEPYNIHAFGAYNPQKTKAEQDYAAMKADLNKAESIQYDSKGREALDNLTEDQTAALEVLASTEGVPAAAAQADYDRKVAARETLLASGLSEDELSQLVNYQRNIPKREKNAERYAKVQEMARNEGEKSPIGGTLLSVPANLLSGVGAIDAALRKLADPNTPTDYNAPAMLPYAYASGVRGEVTKNLQYDHGDAAAFAYGVGTSMLDSAATAALAALGVPPAAASATLGGAAATDAMVAAKDRGLDDSHAIVTGVAAGVMESFFEKVSLESLIHMKLPTGTAKQKLAGMLKNAAIQGGIEGSEEMFTDLANLWWDKVINGGMADVNQRIAVYMAGGMSYQEAQQKVVGETIKDIALDFGAGALAGGIMGGGNMAVQTAAQGRYQDAMQQIRQQSGVTGAYQASEDGRTTYHDTDAQIRSVVKDGKVQLESGETVDPKDVRFKDQQTADLYEGAINTAENAGAAQVFVDSYTGGDVSRYLLGMRQAYEAGRAGIPVEEMTRGTFADDLSEVQRSAAYEQGRLTTEAEFPTMGDMGLGESGSAAWAKAEKINTTLSKGKVQAGFTALYQAGLRRESAANVKSAAASALPQSVQTAAYEAGLSDAAASLAREKAGLDFVSSAGSESGLVDNEHSRKMAKEQAGTAALLNTLGKNLGVRIEMVETISGGKANGVYISSRNLIQIAADANTAVDFVAAHEVTHRMQELAPEEYRAYRDHAMSYRARESGEEGAAAYVVAYMAKAEEAGVKLTQEEAMDEIAADFTRDMMENGNLFEDFAKENRSAAKKLLDALKAFIAKVKSLFRSKAAQDRAAQDAYGKSMAELEQCVALWQKAYDAAGKQAQKTKTAAREGDGEGRYQLKSFSEQAVSTALYDALSEKATRQNQLIPVSVMPRYISEKLGIGGDIYIQRDHAYENMVSKEQAIQDGRPTQRKGENVHFHDLGVEKMTRAIMSINEPTMTISTKTKDGNPAVIMMLPEYGNNNAPLYAVLSFYSRKTISPENRETRPHVVLTIAERNFFEDGGRVGWAELIRNAVKEGRVLDFNKKERSSLSEVAQSAGLGDITDASLKKNLAQFQKEVKQFRESNNIRYQLKSATELEQEVRELKKERRALENRNKVLTERVAKWRGETALDVLSDMVQHQRSAAQALQATRILKQLSPETQLYQAQRSIANLQTQLNEEYGDDKAPKLKIDQTLAEQFMKAADQAERDAVLANIYRDIGKQMPSRFKDKWNAWRYLAMLGNVRTHVRNVVGNAGFVPVVAAKNVVATGIEKAVYRLSGGKMERSKEFVTGKGGKALLQAAAQDYAKVADVAMGGGKYSDFANANKTLETQHFIGQITKRANRPPVTTYSGIAVLTLIQLFALQTQPHGRIAVDAFCRHKADNTAAVSANMGYLQPHAPLRSPCGFFASRLCFRRGHAELCLHIERILRGERQHSRLGDAQRNGAAQCPQAAFQPIHRKAVVTGRLSRQRNDRQCRVGGTDLTGAAKGQPIPVKVQDRSVVHARGSGHLQCAAQFLGIAQHRKCVLCPRNETVCVHIAAVHEPCGKLKTLFHKDELPVSHANGKCVLFLAELGQLFQIGSRDKKRLVTGTLLISLCGNNADAIAANGAQAIRSQAEVYAAQQGHIAVVRVCGKCRTAYHGRNTAELHHAFRSSDVHAWETFAAGCWYLIVRMVTG